MSGTRRLPNPRATVPTVDMSAPESEERPTERALDRERRTSSGTRPIVRLPPTAPGKRPTIVRTPPVARKPQPPPLPRTRAAGHHAGTSVSASAELHSPPPSSKGAPTSFASLPKVLVVDLERASSAPSGTSAPAALAPQVVRREPLLEETAPRAAAKAPPKSRSALATGSRIVVLCLLCTAVATAWILVRRQTAGSLRLAGPVPDHQALHALAPAPPSTTPVPEVPASAAPADVDGLVRPTGATGRRIFVDGATVGQTPSPVKVRCGVHTIRIGSAGRPQTVDVPCGGEIEIAGR